MSRASAFVSRNKLLLVIYVLGVGFGLREYLINRGGDPVDFLSDRWADMTGVVAAVNPDDPDTEFLEGMRSLAQGDPEEYVRRFEAALAADVKHNQFLLHDYAQILVNRGSDWRAVNEAVNRWRENFPFSAETLALQLGSGPQSQAEVEVLRRELARVPWIANSQVERYTQDGTERWQVLLTFRPPRPVDVREAVAAVSILSVPEADRARLQVNCITLQDCRVGPRVR